MAHDEGDEMSHYGTPPPDEPEGSEGPAGSAGQPTGDQPPGSHASEPAPYNPYPDDWDAVPGGQRAFVAGAPSDSAGDPAANPYPAPANPYPAPANPYAPAGNPDRPTFGFGGYAGWLTRVGAYLIDYLLGLLAGFPLIIGYAVVFSDATTTTDPDGTKHLHVHQTGLSAGLIALGAVMSLIFQIWNLYVRQGRTGASIGKSVLAIRLVNSDLQPIGPGWAFLRSLLHILDALPCYLGFLWPIWDSRKQTFADKILTSFVIHATATQPRM
jgi:uncharacterized RDD family membrane protein YckC